MEGLLFLGIAIVVVLAAAASREVSWSVFCRLFGDWQVHKLLKRRLPASHYTVLRDLTLPFEGGTVRIEDLVVSPYGIFVIETQHLAGWIFGSVRDATWTKATRRRQSVFPNPLHHNYDGMKALEAVLQLRQAVYHPLVVFTGDTRFETPLPPNVTQLGGLALYIQARTVPVIDFDDIPGMLAKIEQARVKRPEKVPSAKLVKLWSVQAGMPEPAQPLN